MTSMSVYTYSWLCYCDGAAICPRHHENVILRQILCNEKWKEKIERRFEMKTQHESVLTFIVNKIYIFPWNQRIPILWFNLYTTFFNNEQEFKTIWIYVSFVFGTHTFVSRRPLEVTPRWPILRLRLQKKHYDKIGLLMPRDIFVPNVESFHKVLHDAMQAHNRWKTFRMLLHLPVTEKQWKIFS